MIRTILLYYLLDISINNFFDKVFDNFQLIKFDVSLYHVGDYLHIRLIFENKTIVLRKCKLESKNGNIATIISTDFEVPFKLIVEDGTIVDIQGDMYMIYRNIMKL